VAEVGLSFDPATMNFRPRVLITFYPERLTAHLSAQQRTTTDIAGMTTEARGRILRHLVEDRGLRAKLESGNLLTGEQYVGFEYVPNAPKPKVDWSQDPLVLPVESGGLASIEAKLNSILTKVDNMPIGKMGDDVKNILASLNQTLKTTDALLGRLDAEWVPEGTKTMEELHRAIADADRSLLGRDAPTSQNLHDTLQEVAAAARSIRVFIDYLERHPEILIRGKKEEQHP
jgi:paraquat-inducible protein B